MSQRHGPERKYTKFVYKEDVRIINTQIKSNNHEIKLVDNTPGRPMVPTPSYA
jgi:hypothetical protein